MDTRGHNRRAWDKWVDKGDRRTVPVTSEQIALVKQGRQPLDLGQRKPLPPGWLPPLAGAKVLCLASGGGQQGPLLAAAGAKVTVFDNSPRQLDQDRMVAKRDGLSIETVEGDMTDLSVFGDGSFDLVVNPVSVCFVENVRAVWAECFRVLRSGGMLHAAFPNPVIYSFDFDLAEKTGELKVIHPLPYADEKALTGEQLKQYVENGGALEYSHSLEELIGGQLDAGFQLTGLIDDSWDSPEAKYMPNCIVTRAIKP